MSKIYLASPYTHNEQAVEDWRWKQVAAFAAKLSQEGHIVYCPIGFWHPIARQFGLKGDYKTWMHNDRAFISWCEIFMVYCLEEWGNSEGIRSEIAYAAKQGKEVVFEDPI